MTSPLHALAIGTFVPMLETLAVLLDKGAEALEPGALLQARLAPDMYALAKQVQLACGHAQAATAHLMGQASPAFDDGDDQTLDALKDRITRTLAYLQAVRPADLAGADTADIRLPLPHGLELDTKGDQFLRDWALPHFYFHVVTAYDILRHRGVQIGKQDYLRHVGGSIHRRAEPARPAAGH